MTTEELRDHFAGQALAGLLAQTEEVETGDDGAYRIKPNYDPYVRGKIKDAAEHAYQLADAMLIARGY